MRDSTPSAAASEQLDPYESLNVYVAAQGEGVVSWHVSAAGWSSYNDNRLCYQRYIDGTKTYDNCLDFSTSVSPSGSVYCPHDGATVYVDAQVYVNGSLYDSDWDVDDCIGEYELGPCFAVVDPLSPTRC